jgi:hypothetical protein
MAGRAQRATRGNSIRTLLPGGTSAIHPRFTASSQVLQAEQGQTQLLHGHLENPCPIPILPNSASNVCPNSKYGDSAFD